MSFDINYFTAITPRKKGAITIYTYDASAVGDSIADVTTANYFPVGGLANVDIEPQDVVKVQAADGLYEVQLVDGVASVVTGTVGNEINILQYGASSDDIGPALLKAWNELKSVGGTRYLKGNFFSIELVKVGSPSDIDDLMVTTQYVIRT